MNIALTPGLPMSHNSKKVLISLALALGLSSSTATSGFAEEKTVAAIHEAKPPVINVIPAGINEMVATLTVTGTIVPRQEVAVGTDVAGLLVLELNADQGDVVKEGDILARLDKSSLEIQLAQIEAQRAQADASIAQSEAQIVDAEISRPPGTGSSGAGACPVDEGHQLQNGTGQRHERA